jgi:hypothetical protein
MQMGIAKITLIIIQMQLISIGFVMFSAELQLYNSI